MTNMPSKKSDNTLLQQQLLASSIWNQISQASLQCKWSQSAISYLYKRDRNNKTSESVGLNQFIIGRERGNHRTETTTADVNGGIQALTHWWQCTDSWRWQQIECQPSTLRWMLKEHLVHRLTNTSQPPKCSSTLSLIIGAEIIAIWKTEKKYFFVFQTASLFWRIEE